MHELALCGSIAEIVRNHAAGREVRTIRLRIGELRQVVPDTLTYCWAIVTDSTPLAGAELEIERVPASVRCTACDSRYALGEQLCFTCPTCGSSHVTVVEGEEFLVASLDLVSAGSVVS